MKTAWKVSNTEIVSPHFPAFRLNTEIYGVISVFSPNAGKYGPEKTPNFDTFQSVENRKLNRKPLQKKSEKSEPKKMKI